MFQMKLTLYQKKDTDVTNPVTVKSQETLISHVIAKIDLPQGTSLTIQKTHGQQPHPLKNNDINPNPKHNQTKKLKTWMQK